MVIADVDDEKSLNSMAASTRVLLNCVGPFRYWGEPVVKACIGAGTHYLDICGEPGMYPPIHSIISGSMRNVADVVILCTAS